jgi:hypothetical protein
MQRTARAYDRVVMSKSLKCPIRVVWVFRRTQWIALFSTDLELTKSYNILLQRRRDRISKRSPNTLRTGFNRPALPNQLSVTASRGDSVFLHEETLVGANFENISIT